MAIAPILEKGGRTAPEEEAKENGWPLACMEYEDDTAVDWTRG